MPVIKALISLETITILSCWENGLHGGSLQQHNKIEEVRSYGRPTAVREEQQNSIRDISIYDEINNVIQYSKEQDFNNSVEIHKYLEWNLVQGRSLEIADTEHRHTLCDIKNVSIFWHFKKKVLKTGLHDLFLWKFRGLVKCMLSNHSTSLRFHFKWHFLDYSWFCIT